METIDELAEEDQVIAPTREEVAEELGVSTYTVSEWVSGDYAHAARTAGYVPNRDRTLGDRMVGYNELNDEGLGVSKRNIQERSPANCLYGDLGLTHTQAREKLGLDPNGSWREFYDQYEPGENYEHKLHGIIHDTLEKEDRPPTDSELNRSILNPYGIPTEEKRYLASAPYEPVVANRRIGALSGEREAEVFEFWVEEDLGEDWGGKSNFEVGTIMRFRMGSQDISKDELYSVARKYGKWVDLGRFED